MRPTATTSGAGPPGGIAPRLGLDTPFDPAQGYGNWWWGITPSALGAMVEAAGFEVRERHERPFHVTLVARPRG